MSVSVRARHAAARFLAALLLAGALLVNPWTVAYYTVDGRLDPPLPWLVFGAEVVAAGMAAFVFLRRPRWSPRAALVAGGVVVAGVTCEALAAWTGFLLPADHYERRDTFFRFQQPDAELGFRLHPNLHRLPMSWTPAGLAIEYETDALGYRNPGRDYAASDLFFVGDSFAFGVWVEREETFYGVIEKRLERPVISLGVGGYGFAQYRVLVERFLQTYQPKVLALCVFANDLEALPGADRLQRWYEVEGWSAYEQTTYPDTGILRSLSRSLGARLAQGEGLRRSSGGLALYYRGVASPQYLSSSEHDQVEAALLDIVQLTRQRGVTLKVFTFPSKESAYKDEYLRLYSDEYRRGEDFLANEEVGYVRLCELARGHGVECLDLTDVFRRRAAQEPPIYFADDGHWNALGHRLAADAIYSVVEPALGPAAATRTATR